jgi:predicted aspartyl protease
MPVYDDSLYDPPAPIADVILRNPMSGATLSEVHLLIDTGADVTLLPQVAVEALGIRPVAGIQYQLAGFDGSKIFAEAVELDLIFLHKRFRGRYLITKSNQGVLGRDVLAGVALALDGPRQIWFEFLPSEPR